MGDPPVVNVHGVKPWSECEGAECTYTGCLEDQREAVREAARRNAIVALWRRGYRVQPRFVWEILRRDYPEVKDW